MENIGMMSWQYEKQKMHDLWPSPWKRSAWQNPDQERTNYNARIHPKTALPFINRRIASASARLFGLRVFCQHLGIWPQTGPQRYRSTQFDSFIFLLQNSRYNQAISIQNRSVLSHAMVAGYQFKEITANFHLVKVYKNQSINKYYLAFLYFNCLNILRPYSILASCLIMIILGQLISSVVSPKQT